MIKDMAKIAAIPALNYVKEKKKNAKGKEKAKFKFTEKKKEFKSTKKQELKKLLKKIEQKENEKQKSLEKQRKKKRKAQEMEANNVRDGLISPPALTPPPFTPSPPKKKEKKHPGKSSLKIAIMIHPHVGRLLQTAVPFFHHQILNNFYTKMGFYYVLF